MRPLLLAPLLTLALASAVSAQPAVGGKPAAKPAAAPAAAPAASGVRRFGDFIVRCAATKSVAPCDLYEERADKNTNQRVIGFSVGYMPSANRYIMQLAVPLGIDIQKGVTVTDGKLTTPTMPYRRCDQTGCYVEAAVDKSLLDLFAKMGSSAHINVTSYNGDGAGKVYPFTFSFDGFSAALDDMVAQNKAKAVSPEAAADAR